MMKSTAANGGLRRLLFAGGLAATGAAAVLSPDWSAALKAQGYYGNVDLSVTAVNTSPGLRPGQTFGLIVSVRNQGPDTAHRVRTVATAQQLRYVGTSSGPCDGPQYPQCALAASLDAGSTATYVLAMEVPVDARNHAQFSVSAMADDTEITPGDEIALLKLPIEVPLDLRSDIACARAGTAGERSVVRCSIRFLNNGTFAARLPRLQASVAMAAPSPLSWSCEASQPSLCAGATAQGNGYAVSPAMLPIGNWVTFFVETLPRGAAPVITLDADARLNPAMGETDLVPGNNHSVLPFEPGLFVDGFEPAG